MEAETIDLTTPIPQVLKNTNWTGDNHSNNAAQTKVNESNVQNSSFFLSNAHESNTSNQTEPNVVKKTEETIVLSDDDETSDTARNVCEVNEVNVIEVIEDSDSSFDDKSHCEDASVNKLSESTSPATKDISYNKIPCSITKVNQSQCFSVDLTGSDSDEEETCNAPLLTPMEEKGIKKTDVLKTIRAIDYLKKSSSEPLNVESSFEGIHATITPIMVQQNMPEISMPKIVDVRSLNTQTSSESSEDNLDKTVKEQVNDGSNNPEPYDQSISMDKSFSLSITDETLEVQKETNKDISIANDNIITTTATKKETETRNFIFDKDSDENVSSLIQTNLTNDSLQNDEYTINLSTLSDVPKCSTVEENTENSKNEDSFCFDETNSSDISLDFISTSVKIAVETILEDTNTPMEVQQNLKQTDNSKSQEVYVKTLDLDGLNSDVIEIEELNDSDANISGPLPESNQDATSSSEDNTTVKIDKDENSESKHASDRKGSNKKELSLTEPVLSVEESNTTALSGIADNLSSSNHSQENTIELLIEEAEQCHNVIPSEFKNKETSNCDRTTSTDTSLNITSSTNVDYSESILNIEVVKTVSTHKSKENLEKDKTVKGSSASHLQDTKTCNQIHNLVFTSQLNKEQDNTQETFSDEMFDEKAIADVSVDVQKETTMSQIQDTTITNDSSNSTSANLVNSNDKSLQSLNSTEESETKDRSVNIEKKASNGNDIDLASKDPSTNIDNNDQSPVLSVEQNSTSSSLSATTSSYTSLIPINKPSEGNAPKENDSSLVQSPKEITEIEDSIATSSLASKAPVSDIVNEQNLDEKHVVDTAPSLDANDISTTFIVNDVQMNSKNTENVVVLNTVEAVKEDNIETSQCGRLSSDNENNTNLFLEDVDKKVNKIDTSQSLESEVIFDENKKIVDSDSSKQNLVSSNLGIDDSQRNNFPCVIAELASASHSVQNVTKEREEDVKEANPELKQPGAEEKNNYKKEEENQKQDQTEFQDNVKESNTLSSVTINPIGESRINKTFMREISESSSDDVFEEFEGSKSIQDAKNLRESEKTTTQEDLAEEPKEFQNADGENSVAADVSMTSPKDAKRSLPEHPDQSKINNFAENAIKANKNKDGQNDDVIIRNEIPDISESPSENSDNSSEEQSVQVCGNVESRELEINSSSDSLKSELCLMVDQESSEFSTETNNISIEVKKEEDQNVGKNKDESQQSKIINENGSLNLDKLKNPVKFQLTNLDTNKRISIVQSVSSDLLNTDKKNVKYLMVKKNLISEPNPIGKMILTKLSTSLKTDSKNDQKVQITSISNQEKKGDTSPDLQVVKSVSSTKKEDLDQIEHSEESATEPEINPFGIKSASLSLEDVRKNLKMQLTSLRMRKKMDILQNVKQTINNESMYTSQKNHDTNVASSSRIIEPINKTPVIHKTINPETTDTTRENTESFHQENEDLPNIFNEIRKIIRKQKSVPNESSFSSQSLPSFKTTVTNTTNSDNSNDSLLETQSKNRKLTIMPKSLPARDIEKPSESKGSPFVSNSLDEFLTDSKLNVSYAIPKSGAEEGLRENNYNDPIMLVDPQIKSEENSDKPKEKTEYKPKTLAEKRKIFERKKRMEEKRLNKLNYLKERQKGSYVLFKNEKVFVKSRTTRKCLAAVESTISKADLEPSEQQTSPSKPSLLQEYYRKSTKLKFMPGPLSKKHLLQSDYSEWRSELKTLPKCVVDLLPEFRKPVHPNLLPHVLKQWNAEISEDHLEFALAALDNKEQTKTFQFNVNYDRSQDKLLCRKKIKDHLDVKPIEPVEEEEVKPPVQVFQSEVAKVIEDLIKYVEIKELAPSLIKDDTDAEPLINPVEIIPDTTESKPMIKKRKPRRLACTNRELLRLNCKVISVDVKENEPKVKCSKPYCQLGCVCDSLNCPTIIGAHCRKTKCLFMCTCPKSRNRVINITLPSNNGELLSVDAVTRIEDEAKRNLAREEKEFTQTVIYSQEGALVVGSGYKSRRVTKTPRKYTEFFEDIDDIVEGPKKTYIAVKPCSVDLERHNFSSIIPYCLGHHLYDCHCDGYSRLFPKRLKTTDGSYKKEPELASESRKRSFKKSNSISDEDFIKEESSESFESSSGRSIRKKKCTIKPDYVLWNSSSRLNKSRSAELTKPHTYILGPDGCARVNEVDKKYLDSKPLTEEATAGDFVNNLAESDFLKMNLNKDVDEKLLNECDRLKKDLIDMTKSLIIASNVSRTGHKRKQELKIRQYGSNDIQTAQSSSSIKSRVTPVFPGEIIVTDPLWLQKLSRNTERQNCLVGSYARILPWAALIQGFILKRVNIYCVYDMPLRLLLNVGPKLQGKNLLDIETNSSFIMQTPLKGTAPWLIKQSENIRDIVKWLLTGALSPKYNPQTLSFLLVETVPGQFEVRGLCTQTQKLQESIPSETKSESVSTVIRQDFPKRVSTTVVSEEVTNEPTEVKHKNMRGEVVSLFISRQHYPLRELIEDGCDDDLTDNLYMWVSLPEVKKVAKWRVVFLNQDFVYLHFKNIDYSIKYNDLVKLTQIAKEENTTLLVKNAMLQRNHNHDEFGMYVSPKYSDRIFIGPYLIHYDEEDLDQLKYISKILVSAQTLHKMKGNDRYTCGHWMYESSYNQPPEVVLKPDTSCKAKPSATTTKNIEAVPDVAYVPTQVRPAVQMSDEPVQIVEHNGFTVRIKTTKPRQPADFNRLESLNLG